MIVAPVLHSASVLTVESVEAPGVAFISLHDVKRNLAYWRWYRCVAVRAVELAGKIGSFGPAALSGSVCNTRTLCNGLHS